MSQFFTSKPFYGILVGLASLIILFAVFHVGVEVGERKARQAFGFSDHYGRMFGGPRGSGRMLFFNEPVLPPTHGVFGKVISVSGNSVVVQGADSVEQNVLVTTSTQIRSGRGVFVLGDMKPGFDVGVFGVPGSEGRIDARLIRVIPTP